MQISLKVLKKITMVVVLMGLNGCALYSSKPVTNAVNEGKLEIGMSSQEVRRVVGEPFEVSKQELEGGNTRAVWTYREYDTDIRSCTLVLLSCSSDIFVPFPPTTQYIEFYNDKVVGWDMSTSSPEELP